MSADPTQPSTAAFFDGRAAGHAAVALLALGALMLLGALLQQQFGLFGHREWPLPPAGKIRADGKAYKAKLPEWGVGRLAESQVGLRRDGKPIGMKVPHARTVVERGGGSFKIQREFFYFSLTGDEDPRPIRSSIAVSLPRPVKPFVWAMGAAFLLIGGLLAARNAPARATLARTSRAIAIVPAPAVVGIVFLAALSVTIARLPDAARYSDGCFAVKGVPYSDASGWDGLAVSVAEGRGFTGGFSAQRPLFPTMVGLLYTVMGHSLTAARLLNGVWLAIAAAAVCAIGMAGGSRAAGLVAAISVLIGEDYVSFSKLLLTETSGVAFGAAAVLVLGFAIEAPKWWRIALAGLLLGCSNLASGFAMFALPGYGMVALVTWWARHGMKPALMRSCLLAGVVLLSWMPWLVRQKVVHGLWNLSNTSAVSLYAAATPEYGKWSVASGSAWKVAGVPDEVGARYKFYMEKFAEQVKADPGAYARTVLRNMKIFADFWTFDGPAQYGVVLLGLVLAAAAALRSHRAWAVLIAAAIAIAACTALRGRTADLVWLSATLLALATCSRSQRPLWLLVAITIPSVAFLVGITGGNLGRRMWTACEWGMPLLLVAGGAGLIRMLATWLGMLADRRASKPGTGAAPAVRSLRDSRLGSVGTVLGILLAGQAALSSGVAASLYLFHGKDSRSAQAVAPAVREKAHALASAHFDFLKPLAPADERVWIHPAVFGEYVCHLEASEDEQHWARSFQVRPYARTVGFARQLDAESELPCEIRAPIEQVPRNRPLLLVGVRNADPAAHLGHDLVIIELLGWIPLREDSPSAEPDWDAATWLPAPPEAMDIAKKK